MRSHRLVSHPRPRCTRYTRLLRRRLRAWRVAGASSRVLRWIAKGVDTPSAQHAPARGFGVIAPTAQESHFWFSTEERRLLELGIISRVPYDDTARLIKCFFVPKGHGYRLILDGRPINNLVIKESFKYESLSHLGHHLLKKRFAFSFDISDAFYHMSLSPTAQQQWRFQVGNVQYSMVGLPMGFSHSPFILTKVLKVFVTVLRREGIFVFPYLDDFLVAMETKASAYWARGRVEFWLKALGLTRKLNKGTWEPTQRLDHLGLIIDFTQQVFVCPPEKLRKAQRLAVNLICLAKANRRFVPANTLRKALGFFQSLALAVPGARAYQRSLWDCFCCRSKQGAKLSRQAIRDLRFWADIPKSKCLRTYLPPLHDCSISFDASKSGWGGVLHSSSASGLVAQGFWNPQQKLAPITHLELLAAFNSLRAFVSQIRHSTVHLKGDNQATQQVLANFVSRSKPMMAIVRELIHWTDENGVVVDPLWIPTTANEADYWSRLRHSQLEDYAVDKAHFKTVCTVFGVYPTLDLFGSAENSLTGNFVSQYFQPGAVAVDAFSLPNWSTLGHVLWINPPWSLLPKVLARLQLERPTALVVVPRWEGAIWWPLAKGLGPFVELTGPVYRRAGQLLPAPQTWTSVVFRCTKP